MLNVVVGGLALIAVIPYAAPVVLCTRRIDWCEPAVFVCLPVLLGTTLRTWYLLGNEDVVRSGTLLLGRDLDVLLPGLVAIGLGGIAFAIGYMLPVKRVSAGQQWFDGPVRLRRPHWILLATAVAFVATWSTVSLLGEWDLQWGVTAELAVKRRQYLSGGLPVEYSVPGYKIWAASLLVVLGWVLLGKQMFGRNGRQVTGVVLGVLAFGGGLFVPFVASSRTQLFLPVLVLLVILYYSPKKMNKWVVGLVSAAILVGSVIMQLLRRGITRAEQIFGILTSPEVIEPVMGVWHFAGVAKTSLIIEGVPSRLDYLMGRSVISWIFAPVPRAMWPEKPLIRIGGEIGPALFRVPETSGVPPGFIGEMFLNFGWFGVVGGMLVLGVLLRTIYVYLGPRQGEPRRVIVYAAACPVLAYMLMSNDVSGALIRTAMYLIPLMCLLAWAKPSKENRRVTARLVLNRRD